jgi:hypothetical protein
VTPSPRPSPGGRGSGDDDYRKTPFLSILLYVLLLMGTMALLAAVAVWLLRR